MIPYNFGGSIPKATNENDIYLTGIPMTTDPHTYNVPQQLKGITITAKRKLASKNNTRLPGKLLPYILIAATLLLIAKHK